MSTGKVSAARAFTLIELLVVVAIIALLISILLPSLSKAREQGKRTVCLANLHHCGQGFTMYASEHKQVLPIRGAYSYNIREPENMYMRSPYYRFDANGVRRSPVNHGALYGKYCGTKGVFYYCPSNLMYVYDNRNNGWPSYFNPDAGVTWGGYSYAATIRAGCFPVEAGAMIVPGSDPARRIYMPKFVDFAGATKDKQLGREPTYESWLVEQLAANRDLYTGRRFALMSDILVDPLSHNNGIGFNVLYDDHHAKWVPDSARYIKGLPRSSGPGGRPGLFEAFNIFAKKY